MAVEADPLGYRSDHPRTAEGWYFDHQHCDRQGRAAPFRARDDGPRQSPRRQDRGHDRGWRARHERNVLARRHAGLQAGTRRSEGRRVGEEWVRTSRTRWTAQDKKKKKDKKK